MTTAPAPKFALFVSSVEGALVRRYGSAVHIGARAECLNPEEPRPDRHRYKYRWTDEVVAIPDVEFQRYRREYTRAIADGSLRTRTEDEWRKQAAAAERAAAEAAKRKADARAAKETPVQDKKGKP